MLNQRYDVPEKLAGTDAEVVQWRRLVVTKHFGGRNHPFEQRTVEELDELEEAPGAGECRRRDQRRLKTVNGRLWPRVAADQGRP